MGFEGKQKGSKISGKRWSFPSEEHQSSLPHPLSIQVPTFWSIVGFNKSVSSRVSFYSTKHPLATLLPHFSYLYLLSRLPFLLPPHSSLLSLWEPCSHLQIIEVWIRSPGLKVGNKCFFFFSLELKSYCRPVEVPNTDKQRVLHFDVIKFHSQIFFFSGHLWGGCVSQLWIHVNVFNL